MEQYGFGKGISTENAAFRLTGGIFKYINHKKQAARNLLWFGSGFWLC